MNGLSGPASGPGSGPHWAALDAALDAADAAEEAALAALTALPADAAPEVREAALDALADAQEATLCAQEDHRLCQEEACPHAALWWPRVRAVGGAALAASGRAWAVLCLVPACSGADGRPRLLTTTDSLASATGCRNWHYGSHDGYERRGVPSVHGWCPMLTTGGDGPRIA